MLLNKPEEFNMGLTGVIGATIFEMTVGLGLGSMLLKKSYKLSYMSIVKDIILYIISLLVLFLILDSREISLVKSSGMVVLWIFFCIYLYFTSNTVEEDLELIKNEYEVEKEDFENTILTNDLEKESLVKWDANNSIIISDEKNCYYDSSKINSNNNKELNNLDYKYEDDEYFIEQANNNSNFIKNNNNIDNNQPSTIIPKKFQKFQKFLNNYNTNSSNNLQLNLQILNTLSSSEVLKIKKKLNYLEQYDSDIIIILYAIANTMTVPWEKTLSLFLPEKNSPLSIIWKLSFCILAIWFITNIEVSILEVIIAKFNLTSAFVGTTILSWGNNTPALFNVAYAMKKGLVEMSFNAIISSDIHSLLLGLGSSWLVYNLKYDKSVILDKSIGFMKYCIFYYMFFLILFLAVLYLNRMRMNHTFSIFLFIVYLIFLMIISTITTPGKEIE